MPPRPASASARSARSEEHTSELQSRLHLVCRLLLEKKKKKISTQINTQSLIPLAYLCLFFLVFFFFFNDTATTEIYTLSLHDALPISPRPASASARSAMVSGSRVPSVPRPRDRKSTRLNSSHGYISYAVFCLKKK